MFAATLEVIYIDTYERFANAPVPVNVAENVALSPSGAVISKDVMIAEPV